MKIDILTLSLVVIVFVILLVLGEVLGGIVGGGGTLAVTTLPNRLLQSLRHRLLGLRSVLTLQKFTRFIGR